MAQKIEWAELPYQPTCNSTLSLPLTWLYQESVVDQMVDGRRFSQWSWAIDPSELYRISFRYVYTVPGVPYFGRGLLTEVQVQLPNGQTQKALVPSGAYNTFLEKIKRFRRF